MDNNLPVPIYNDEDLLFYEDYLKQEFTTINTQKSYEYLKNFLNCIVKIDCEIANRIESKIGTLETFGEDFLVITLQNQKKSIILLKCVKFITILQNSKKHPYSQ